MNIPAGDLMTTTEVCERDIIEVLDVPTTTVVMTTTSVTTPPYYSRYRAYRHE